MNTQLVRSSNDKMIGGVASGLAHYFGIDPVLVRLGFVFLTLTTGLGLFLYVALWLVMPQENGQAVWKGAVQSAQQFGQSIAANVHTTGNQPRFDPQTGQPLAQTTQQEHRNHQLGMVLLGVGTLMLASFAHITGPVIALALLGSGYYLLRHRQQP